MCDNSGKNIGISLVLVDPGNKYARAGLVPLEPLWNLFYIGNRLAVVVVVVSYMGALLSIKFVCAD